MLDARAAEHEIAAAARHYAGRARAILHAVDRRTGLPVQALASELDNLARECRAKPVGAKVSLSGRITRMVSPRWWNGNLRRELIRFNEAEEHAAGRIRRRQQCYVSDHALRMTTARNKAVRELLNNLEAENERGAAVNLLDAADASVSNPKNRRGELMVRCRGFEEVAAMMGHEALFVTLTCPSRFHRFNAQGRPNPRYEGATPRDAQAYLKALWARIRAEWQRQGFAPYGFRVAEPHHDGCPHWHMVLFAPERQAGWFVPQRLIADRKDHGAGIMGIMGAYALADSPGEPGALKHRFTCVRIDTSKGSATGYLSKYISKNIDGLTEHGEGIGLDYASGTRAIDSAKRVRAWASTWGIRQFQQIGGPSVTVYRELRRLAQDAQQPVLQLDIFEGPRSAADRALWALFWFVQGGPDVPRHELTLRPAYEDRECGMYGDQTRRVHGVLGIDTDTGEQHFQLTRMHTWTVQRAGLAAVNAEQATWQAARGAFKKLGFESAADWMDFERSAEGASTWTGVNNCTDGDEEAVRMDFLRGQGGATAKEMHHDPHRKTGRPGRQREISPAPG